MPADSGRQAIFRAEQVDSSGLPVILAEDGGLGTDFRRQRYGEDYWVSQVRRALAQSNFELADLTGKVGRNEDALAAHRAVLAAHEALAAEPGAGVVAKVDVGRSLIAVAELLEATGKTDESLASYRRSESLLAGPAGADPSARAALAAPFLR